MCVAALFSVISFNVNSISTVLLVHTDVCLLLKYVSVMRPIKLVPNAMMWKSFKWCADCWFVQRYRCCKRANCNNQNSWKLFIVCLPNFPTHSPHRLLCWETVLHFWSKDPHNLRPWVVLFLLVFFLAFGMRFVWCTHHKTCETMNRRETNSSSHWIIQYSANEMSVINETNTHTLVVAITFFSAILFGGEQRRPIHKWPRFPLGIFYFTDICFILFFFFDAFLPVSERRMSGSWYIYSFCSCCRWWLLLSVKHRLALTTARLSSNTIHLFMCI